MAHDAPCPDKADYSSMLTMGQLTTMPIGPQGLPSGPEIRPASPSLATELKSVCTAVCETGMGTCAQTDAWTSHIGL